MRDQDIAIVGMAARFPGAKSLHAFWENLCHGVESIRRLSDEELLAAGASHRDLVDPEYVKACPVLEDIDKFDAAFFGMSPRDASVMDPAHRVFLEVAWEALEHSGNTGLPEEGRVGVFATAGAPYYLMDNVRTNAGVMKEVGEFLARHTGNDMNFLATRVSYALDLRGPSMNVQTACSSALVAVHQARISLLLRECDIALAGASTINVPMGLGYRYKEGEILSPDGHCRPFDHRSAGTVFGSGSGCFVLKRAQDAVDAGDTIYALIKGSAVNNDGALKVGYLAPGVQGQVDVIKAALRSADVSAESISYVEAHGTGTIVGDPIELTALSEALAASTDKKHFCGVGSVKSNIGHLGEAAAAAALAKVVLALQHGKLPATLGFERPNPQINVEDGPLYVVDRLEDWKSNGPRRCGITALGAGGTNVHVILEQPPPAVPGEGGRRSQLIVLSAKSRSALDRQCALLADAFENEPEADLPDAAYTLSVGRRSLEWRRVLVAATPGEAATKLRSGEQRHLHTSVAHVSSPRLAITFPGGGAQYAGMGLGLYEVEPAYREAMDECLRAIDQATGVDIRERLFAPPARRAEITKELERPSLSLPALFATEYALARMFESWGLRADAMVGHSMGEYVAACLAGVFSVVDGIRLVSLRGQLFETLEPGSMLAVSLSEERARELMPTGLSIAAINGPELCVVSGPSSLVEGFKLELTAADVDWTPIHIEVAAHSSMLEPILDEFRRFCHTVALNPPTRPVTSNLSGGWLTDAQATDPEYWVQHLRSPVRFAECVATVLRQAPYVFLEVGPGRTLTSLANAQTTKPSHSVNSMRHWAEEADDLEYALLTLGKVWASGVPVDWTAFYDGQLRNRVALPTYPFETTSYFLYPTGRTQAKEADLLKRASVEDWFHTLVWNPTPLIPGGEPATKWLVVADTEATASGLARDLWAAGARAVVVAVKGNVLRRVSKFEWRFSPGNRAHFAEMFESFEAEGMQPEHTVFAVGVGHGRSKVARDWLVSTSEELWQTIGSTESRGESGALTDYLTLVHLVRALVSVDEQSQLSVVTSRAFSLGNEPVEPHRRLLVGPVRVVPREVPEIETRLIDMGEGDSFGAVVAELRAQSADRVVLLRGSKRWTQSVVPTRLPKTPSEKQGEVEHAPYAIPEHSIVGITGGLGGIALVLARHLARRKGARIALFARTQLPHRAEWARLLGSSDTPASLRAKLEAVREIEELGAQVMCVHADVTDRRSLKRAAMEVAHQWGPVRVMIHAAGILDDGPFQTKTDEQLIRVLQPKVVGTLNLEHVFGEHLDLFVLFSSVASFLGLPGQVDYAAANAFLDATAEKRARTATGRTIVINWSAWKEVGMVANSGATTEVESLRPTGCRHPWFQTEVQAAGALAYLLDLDSARDWALAEHRIRGGLALLPGTGFIELLRAAFAEHHPDVPIELTEVRFLSPLQAGPQQKRRVRVQLEPIDGGAQATVTVVPEQSEHASAQVRVLEVVAPEMVDIHAVAQRCTTRVDIRNEGFLNQDFMIFGPRWGNIRSIHSGVGEALLHLELPPRFASDLPELAFHPALMDMATGAAQHLLPGFDVARDFYAPFAYERIRIFGPLVQRCWSHVRLDPATKGDIAVFNVTVGDCDGRVLVDVQGFTMKRVRQGAVLLQSEMTPAEGSSRRRALEDLLREAISSDEGVSTFERVLGQPQLDQVIVSSVDVGLWLAQLDTPSASQGTEAKEANEAFSRPLLATEYLAPQNAIEEILAEMWSRLLGVRNPGVLDEFFDLGGDSLVAVRMFARIRKELGVSLPISTLFQAPTIRALGILLADKGVEIEAGKRIDDPAHKKFVPFSALNSRSRRPAFTREPGLYELGWRTTDSLPPVSHAEGGRCWLVFVDDVGLVRSIKQSLVSFGHTVVLVRSGDGYARNSATDYTIAPEQGRESYGLLLRDLVEGGKVPTDVLHMWLVTKDESCRLGSSFFHRTQEEGYFSLLSLAQAIADVELDVPLNVTCVTSSLFAAPGVELASREATSIHDSKATILGVLETMPAELPRVSVRHIDLNHGESTDSGKLGRQLGDTFRGSTLAEAKTKELGTALLAELLHDQRTPVLLTANRRFELEWKRVPRVSSYGATTGPRDTSRQALYCLLGTPTPLVIELIKYAASVEHISFLWMKDTSLGVPDAGPSLPDVESQLEAAGLSIFVEECDATSRRSVTDSIRKHLGEHKRLAGGILAGISSPHELMQLLEPGAAEEALGQEVQSAQVLTSSLGVLNPSAFVLLFARQHEGEAADGECMERSGSSFLASHALRCRQQGQRVTCVTERSEVSGVESDAFAESREFPRQILDAAVRTEITSGALRVVSGRAREAVPLSVHDDAPSVPRQGGVGAEVNAVLSLFRDALGVPGLEPQTSLVEAGATRLAAARLMTHLKNHYRLEQPVAALLRYRSAAGLAALIATGAEEGGFQQTFRHLVAMHPHEAGDGPPFFLVAGMFGNILNLRHLGRLLGMDREVYGVQARGLYGDEKPHGTIEEMAEAYLAEIRHVRPHGPYLLGGFSGGGLVAFEMAKRLRAIGEDVPIVVMLDTPLPQRPKLTYRDRAIMQWTKLQRGGAGYVAEWAKKRVSWELELVRRRFHEVDEAYTPGTFKYDAIQQAFLRAAAAYKVSYYTGKVALYRPALDKAYQVGPERFVNSSRELVLEDQGWSPYVAQIEVWEVPGDHDHMVLEPDVRVLARLVRRRLAEVDVSRQVHADSEPPFARLRESS
jgi:acyl transferase domain-containing protein/thioesterase domain-containing protein/acyl carrier protein